MRKFYQKFGERGSFANKSNGQIGVRTMSKLLLLSALCFVGVGLMMTACSSTPPNERPQLRLASDSTMTKQSAQAFELLKKETPVSLDPALNRYVHCIVDPLTQTAGSSLKISKWEIFIFQSDEINALALPGGKIGINRRLLKAAPTAEQLAAVISHVIGHLLAEHEAGRYSQELSSKGEASLLAAPTEVGTKEAVQANAVLLAVNGLSQYGYPLPYSRTQENDADAVGLKLMAQAGFDPNAALKFWRNLMTKGEKDSAEILATHPFDAQRLEAMESRLASDTVIYESAPVRPRCAR